MRLQLLYRMPSAAEMIRDHDRGCSTSKLRISFCNTNYLRLHSVYASRLLALMFVHGIISLYFTDLYHYS
jgi:hypothetical protein